MGCDGLEGEMADQSSDDGGSDRNIMAQTGDLMLRRRCCGGTN
jgi:hypothetical protein